MSESDKPEIKSELMKTALEAARGAGQVLVDSMGLPRQTKSKGLRDIVTDADLSANKFIIETIRRRFPDHDILTEEGSQEAIDQFRSDYRWIIDPLDGTSNYAHRYPCFSVSVALTYRDELLLGVVYDPLRHHLFRAMAGEGAYLNDERLHVSSTERLIEATVGLDWAHGQALREETARLAMAIAPGVLTLRTLGSAALSLGYVAAGWSDAYFHLNLNAWDMAAGALIVQEAGGRISDLDGGEWHLYRPPCLASNGLLHRAVVDVFQTIQKPGFCQKNLVSSSE